MLEREQKLVLKRINEIRKEAGLGRINKLKRGVPQYDKACCIAMSLAGTRFAQATDFFYWLDENREKEIANAVIDIIAAFDLGEMPEIEIPKTPIRIKKPGERKLTVIE